MYKAIIPTLILHWLHSYLTFIPNVEHTNSMMELSWLLWKYMATSNSISPKEADTPAALRQEEEEEEDKGMQTLELLSSFFRQGSNCYLMKMMLLQLGETTCES